MPTNRHIAKAEAALYASTLLDALVAEGGMDAVITAREQLEQIIAYNRAHVDLTDAMSDMAYTPEERSALIKKVFADCQPALVSVLGVMAERGDVDKLPRVWDSYNQQITEKQGTTVVDVITRVPLDDHLRGVIEKKAATDFEARSF